MLTAKKTNNFTKLMAASLVVILCSSVFSMQSSSYGAVQTGSLNVNVLFTNGDRASNYGIVLKVYQDANQTPFTTITPDSLPATIDSLPLGHKYKIDVYRYSMYAASEYVDLKSSPQEVDISIPIAGALTFNVFYNDGTTPIEGINIAVKSYDGITWGKGTTDSDGKSNKLWLQPTVNEANYEHALVYYYTASFSLGPNFNYTDNQKLQIFTGGVNTIKIVTPWPAIIDNMHVSVYKPDNHKVAESDGNFLVLLSDYTGNQVAQSGVSHGDAYFSKIKIGDYVFHVVKLSQNLLGNEVGSLNATIDGTKSQFNVVIQETNEIPVNLKEGVLTYLTNATQPGKIQQSCNCVIFRLDDVQDHYVMPAQTSVLNLFLLKNADLTIGIITNSTGKSPAIIGTIKEGVKRGVFDIALHGQNHIDYTKLDSFSQWESLSEAQTKLEQLFGNVADIFVPPYNHFDNSTIESSAKVGIRIISAGPTIDKQIYHYSSDASETAIYHVPQQAEYSIPFPREINYLSTVAPEQILTDVDSSLKNYGYSVIALHPQDFAKRDDSGKFISSPDSLNRTQIQSLAKLIDDLEAKNIRFTTFHDVTGMQKRVFPDVGNSSIGIPDDLAAINLFTLGKGPAGVAVNPDTNMVYVTNSKSDSVTVLDGSTGSIYDNIDVGDMPIGVSVNPTTNMIYVINSHSNTVSVIDGATNTASDMPGVKTLAYGLTLNPISNTIYAIDPYAASVDFIDGNTSKVMNAVKVDSPQRIAYNPTTNMIYVTNSKSNSVTVVDSSTNTIAKIIKLGDDGVTVAIAVNPTTNTIYVTNSKSDSVTVIDGSTNTVTNTIQLNQQVPPLDESVDPTTNIIYVTHPSGIVSVIDGNTNAVKTQISLGSGAVPIGVSVNSKTGTIYVADSGSDTLSVINGNSLSSTSSAVPEFSWAALTVLSISVATLMVFSRFKAANLKLYS